MTGPTRAGGAGVRAKEPGIQVLERERGGIGCPQLSFPTPCQLQRNRAVEPMVMFAENTNEGHGPLAGSPCHLSPVPQSCQSVELGGLGSARKGAFSSPHVLPSPWPSNGEMEAWMRGASPGLTATGMESFTHFFKHPLCARPCTGWQDTAATHIYRVFDAQTFWSPRGV